MCTVILLVLTPTLSTAQFVDSNEALKIEKEYLNRRFDGYFRHVQAYKKYQKERVKKVKQHKITRISFEEQLEKKRKAFIEKRKKIKKTEIDIDAIVARQQRARNKIRDQRRLKFIKNKKIMNKLKKTSKMIPEDVDVGLKSLSQELKK